MNTDGSDAGACLSPDGLSLYFPARREEGYGEGDQWVSTREATDQMFGTPTNLGGLINSDRKESSPHISDDGLELWFASERYGGLGKRDIWFSRRASTNDQFGRPQHAGDEINSSADEESPTLTSGGRLLFFESTRSPRRGETTMETIWSSEWNSSAATNE